jgi:Xaa-Pro dipeptidase
MTVASSIAYLDGFSGYLPIEFGRPTILLVYADTDPVILTPLMEGEIAYAMTWFSDVETLQDSGPNRWEPVLS